VSILPTLRAAFTCADPKIVKIKSSCKRKYLFALLRFAHVKAARRTLMKLTPGRQTHRGTLTIPKP